METAIATLRDAFTVERVQRFVDAKVGHTLRPDLGSPLKTVPYGLASLFKADDVSPEAIAGAMNQIAFGAQNFIDFLKNHEGEYSALKITSVLVNEATDAGFDKSQRSGQISVSVLFVGDVVKMSNADLDSVVVANKMRVK